MDLFLLPRDVRCLLVCILLGAVKIDKDDKEVRTLVTNICWMNCFLFQCVLMACIQGVSMYEKSMSICFMIWSKFIKNKTAYKLSHFGVFCLPTELSFRLLSNNFYTVQNSSFLFFGRMVDCMTSCTCVCSTLSVSSSNWVTPQMPNKPQSSQNSTPCKYQTSVWKTEYMYKSVWKTEYMENWMRILLSHCYLWTPIFGISFLSHFKKSNVDESKIFDHIFNWLYLCPQMYLSSKLWNLQNSQKIDAHE